jgi:phosphoserine phosphatase RsbU/P
VATVEILSGPRSGEHFTLSAEHTLLGRDPLCAVVLPSHGVSRQHARIVRTVDGYAIEDVGSVNGTFVNHLRIRERQVLFDQDRIHLYDVKLAFHDEARPRNRTSDDAVTPQPGAPVFAIQPPAPPIVHAFDVAAELESVLGSKAQMRAVLGITRELGGTLDFDLMLPKLLEGLFAVFPQAQTGHVLLADPASGVLTPKAIKQGRAGELVVSDTFRPINQGLVHRVMHEGQALLISNQGSTANESVLGGGALSMICAPLIGPSHCPLGVLYLESEDPRRPFSTDDLELLTSAGVAAGQMVEHAHEHAAALRLARRERDLDAARQMQLNLLPQQRPQVAGYRFFDYYQAADGVGGDYFGYIPLDDGRLMIAVGDVAGKGIPAALLMARLSAEVRYCLATSPTPADAMCRLNAALPLQETRFITFVLCVLDPITHELTVVIAGHMPPLWRKAIGRTVTEVGEPMAGPPLGADLATIYRQQTIRLAPGDMVLLYTDGISEARGPRREQGFYGVARIRRSLASGPNNPAAMGEALICDVEQFARGSAAGDDICLVCFMREA